MCLLNVNWAKNCIYIGKEFLQNSKLMCDTCLFSIFKHFKSTILPLYRFCHKNKPSTIYFSYTNLLSEWVLSFFSWLHMCALSLSLFDQICRMMRIHDLQQFYRVIDDEWYIGHGMFLLRICKIFIVTYKKVGKPNL